VSPEFINYYGNFLSGNTNIVSSAAVNQSGSTLGGSGGISNFAGSITDVGQVSSNRKGFSINAWFDLTKTNDETKQFYFCKPDLSHFLNEEKIIYKSYPDLYFDSLTEYTRMELEFGFGF
jgi:hypothetical protein